MAEAGRGGRGWGTVVGLALIAAALSVVHPALLIFVPLSLLLLALPPRRLPLLALGVVLAVVPFSGWEAAGSIWYAERGWAFLVGGWFVGAVVLLPRAPFLSRGLVALGGALATAALLLVATRGGWTQLDWTMANQIRAGSTDAAALWSAALTPAYRSTFVEAIHRAAELQALLYPALLALGTLAGLAVAWWAYRRLALAEARPLGALRDFRFRDELIWLLIAGIALVLLPGGAAGRRAGSNLLAFMSALYLLRGAGVLLALAGPVSALGVVFGLVAFVLLYPLVVAATLFVGLTDTWLDLRARARARA